MIKEKTNNKCKLYPKWVGILLSLIISGSAQFLSGQRLLGFFLYILIATFGFLSIIILATPLNNAIPIAIIFFIICLLIWCWMLKKSYRHVRKIGFLGWTIIMFISLILNTLNSYITKSVVEVFIIPTSAMEPTLMGNRRDKEGEKIPKSGDRLVVEKISYHFQSP